MFSKDDESTSGSPSGPTTGSLRERFGDPIKRIVSLEKFSRGWVVLWMTNSASNSEKMFLKSAWMTTRHAVWYRSCGDDSGKVHSTLVFGKVWSSSVCWPPCATPGNEAECRIYGGWVKTLVLFQAICGPKFTKFQTMWGTPCISNALTR